MRISGLIQCSSDSLKLSVFFISRRALLINERFPPMQGTMKTLTSLLVRDPGLADPSRSVPRTRQTLEGKVTHCGANGLGFESALRSSHTYSRMKSDLADQGDGKMVLESHRTGGLEAFAFVREYVCQLARMHASMHACTHIHHSRMINTQPRKHCTRALLVDHVPLQVLDCSVFRNVYLFSRTVECDASGLEGSS